MNFTKKIFLRGAFGFRRSTLGIIVYVLDSLLLEQTKFFWAHRSSNQISPTRFSGGEQKNVASTSRLSQLCSICLRSTSSCPLRAYARVESTDVLLATHRDPVLTLLRNFRSAYFFARPFGFFSLDFFLSKFPTETFARAKVIRVTDL